VSLVENIKAIQRHVGAEPDGVFGPVTARRVLVDLENRGQAKAFGDQLDEEALDARTLATLATLDPKARIDFEQFMLHAKALASMFGCDYVAISGTRTWEEQAALYKKYQAGGPKAAPPGYSWHNFGTAIDCGVFHGSDRTYCDESKPDLARRVHAACAAIADQFTLEWGGAWKGKSCDPPHYQINMGRSSPSSADRAKFKAKGSVL
jgi:hypothetical protein